MQELRRILHIRILYVKTLPVVINVSCQIRIVFAGWLSPPPTDQELKLESFHELANVKKLENVLNASLIVRRVLKDVPGISNKLSYLSARWNKRSLLKFIKFLWDARQKGWRSERLRACLHSQARERSRAADDLQFLGANTFIIFLVTVLPLLFHTWPFLLQ